MSVHDLAVPDQLPLLSRGKHRRPRKGACFMELVSFLAGERWSDHPACTHPLLGAVARGVNDFTSEEARPQLAVLIPSVIGLTSDDPRVDVRLALLCARTALPVASAERQRVMAVAVLACERMLDELDRRPAGSLEAATRSALEQAPHAATWARQFARGQRASTRSFRRHAAPNIVYHAVKGIAEGCAPNVDQLLHDLLVEAICECSRWAPPAAAPSAPLDPGTWRDACALTGAAPGR